MSNDNKFLGLDVKQYIYLLSALVILTAISLLGWFSWQFYQKSEISFGPITKDKKEQTKQNKNKDCNKRRKLDGFCIDDTDFEQNPKLAAIMIENHVDSRPPSGLAQARIVYEAPVEGNISRFLAIYTENQEVGQVGPVRSARPYFVDWTREYGDATYMHVGGSPTALDYIEQIGLNDLDQFSNNWYYWRSKQRSKPHNVYTSSKLWSKALENNKNSYQDKKYDSWKFQDREQCSNSSTTSSAKDCITSIATTFASPGYSATWQFNTTSGKYKRYQSGHLHQDKSGKVVTAENVIIQHVDTKVVDNVGRLDMSTIGSGEVEIYVEGKKITGTWQKEAKSDRTKFLNEQGEQIVLEPGTTWITVVNDKATAEEK